MNESGKNIQFSSGLDSSKHVSELHLDTVSVATEYPEIPGDAPTDWENKLNLEIAKSYIAFVPQMIEEAA